MRLAHCSDLHLLSHDGARWLDLANKRWIGAMNLLSNRSRHYHVEAFEDMVADLNALGIEHVLCTGDVTNLALRQEFAFARSKFDRLSCGSRDITVIPGNHDAYVAEGVPLFAEMFGDLATTDPGWAWTVADAGPDERPPGSTNDNANASDSTTEPLAAALRWPIVKLRGELAIVGTSTSRQTPWFTASWPSPSRPYAVNHGVCRRVDVPTIASSPRRVTIGQRSAAASGSVVLSLA
ncbi:MAG: metallophosphoesterase, partial [Myxococcales bacterium]|nr:metallophosphoesterase [Myxococcales bacterium]